MWRSYGAHLHSLLNGTNSNACPSRTLIVLYNTVRRLLHCGIWFHSERMSECRLQALGQTKAHRRNAQHHDCKNAQNFGYSGIGGRIVCLLGSTDARLPRKRISMKAAKWSPDHTCVSVPVPCARQTLTLSPFRSTFTARVLPSISVHSVPLENHERGHIWMRGADTWRTDVVNRKYSTRWYWESLWHKQRLERIFQASWWTEGAWRYVYRGLLVV